MKTQGLHFFLALVLSASLAATVGVSTFVRADDTEVFFPSDPTNSGQRNLLIVLDNNSNWSENSQGFPGQTTGQAEINAIKTAIATLDENTNVGLMQFVTTEGGGDTGGFVRFHMRPMNATNRASLTAILTAIHDNISDPDEKINASSAEYGSLMRDAYNYLSGGLSVSPGKVLASKADAAGYSTAYTRFNSPLDDDTSNCGPTSIVFVSNPSPSAPQNDNAANTAALAAVGGVTTQITVPRTVTYTTVAGTGTAAIGYTSSCLSSLAACTSAVRAANYPSQCGNAADCSCRERFHTTTTTTTVTHDPAQPGDPTVTTATVITNNGAAPANTSSGPTSDGGSPATITSTSTSTVTTATTTTDLPACGAGTQRYTVKGVTNDTAPVSDNTVTSNNITTDPVVSVCLKTNVAGQSLPYTTSCPTVAPQSTPNSPVNGQTTTVTTTWSNCAVPAGASQGGNCSAAPAGNGGKLYTANGNRSVRTVVTNDSAPQSFTTLGNTFACCANSGSCGVADYSTAVAGSANDCTDFNGGCVVTNPTSPNLTPANGSCPTGSRYEVTSNASTILVSPALDDGAYVPAGTATGAARDSSNFDEWARFLQTVGVNGKKINTYTIDVFKNQPGDDYTKLMLSGAKVGGGEYFSATSQTEITNALTEILVAVLDIDTTFAAPAVTVNTFNRLANRDELYFALFKPTADVKWEGNLKKYRLGAVGGVTKIVDAVGADAVDPGTGFFRGTAKSVWSAQVDGSEVSQGGFISRLTTSRNAYVYTGADLPPSATPTPFNLTTSLLNSSNTNITKAMIGLSTTAPDADRVNVLNWASSVDVDDINKNDDRTDARQSIGDPLHSQPVVITYRGPEATPDITVYFGDNEGTLHAVDADDGTEVFSFTPKETLRNLSNFRNNIGSFSNRPYGLDGPIARFHKDLNGDLLPLNDNGTVQSSIVGGVAQNEFVHLYAGMRRGGRNYYSLDVTDRSSPKLRWVIYGGTGDYAELGQTWSEPVVTRIKLNGVTRDVIIFSGGYDPAQDNKLTLSGDTQGRAVYMADAVTGQRLWWASSVTGADLSLSQMVYSTPATPKVIDINADGIADRIYMSDAGGQVFRIFLNPSNTGAATLASGSRIAVLSDADVAATSRTQANARRFFSAPDIALITKNVAEPFLSISLGSGHREKPNGQSIQDRFFVMRDPDEDVGENSTLSIVTSDLYDATANLAQQGTVLEQTAAATALAGSKGFYINLVDSTGAFKGEKVIADSLTFENKVVFASFQPAVSVSACAVVAGRSRLYLLNILNGAAASDLSNYTSGTPVVSCETTSCNSADRAISLMQQGLPPDPTILFPSLGGTLPDEALVCIGAECFEPGLSVETKKTYWLKKSE